MLMKLTFEEKIGQLIIPRLDFNDPEFDIAFYEYLVTAFHIGHFIVFGGDVGRSAAAFNHLQKISRLPILFSADLERGLGQQINGATTFPYFMGLAEAEKKDPGVIYQAAKITALESRALGIHQNFSPVLDINSNPENPIINIRAFGETAETVTRCGLAYVKGLQEHGMIATAKHFPGHGDTLTDSHLELPVILHSREHLERTELAPFREILKQGIDSVMMGHIVVPALDESGAPASLSNKIITEGLRKDWKYDGLIVNDAMMMGAMVRNFSEQEALTRSFFAGADQLLIPVSAGKAFAILTAAIKGDPIAERRLDESVERILRLKQKSGLFENRFVDAGRAEEIIGCEEHQALAKRITRLSFTVKKGIWPDVINNSAAIWLIKSDEKSFSLLEGKLRDRFRIFSLLLDGQENISVPDFSEFKTVVIMMDLKPAAWRKSHKLPESLRQAVDGILAAKDHVMISCGNPYVINTLHNLKNAIATYSSDAFAQEDLAQRL
jgi:beta-N-acetylhexosaminidase